MLNELIKHQICDIK